MSMYRCDDLCLSNEDLVLRIQDGDPQAAPLLLSQNEGYLTMLAASCCAQFSQDFLVDDLKQEGALALLDAARRYDPSMGTKLLTYATPAIETAMRDCAAQGPFSLSLPLDRYHQLRQVAFLYATHEGGHRNRSSAGHSREADGLRQSRQASAGRIPYCVSGLVFGRGRL